jgi:hypothetical protein
MWKWGLLTGVLAVILLVAVRRDIGYEKTYTGDLRNRVTGARLVKDGRSPYFYKWAPGDGLRYYDPANFDRMKPSNMTSTPMLYHLLSPLADLPETEISKGWLAIEYLILISLVLFAFSRAPTAMDKQAVLLAAGLLLLTNGWKSHISVGQTYLCIPLLAMLFLVFWRKETFPAWGFAAGVAAVCLVSIRPNTALFFVPFLCLLRHRSRVWLGCLFLPPLLFACWLLFSPHERRLWSDYFRNIGEAAKFEQQPEVYGVDTNPRDPHFTQWEGIDMIQAARADSISRIRTPLYSENGNVFVLSRLILHRSLSRMSLAVCAVIGTVVLILLYWLRVSPGYREQVTRAAIFGCCLFMIPDLFSPIYRHQYYTVQWILPLLLAATLVSTRDRRWFIVLLGALLLDVVHLGFIKMENTIGEYAWFLTLAALSLTPGGRMSSKRPPASISADR